MVELRDIKCEQQEIFLRDLEFTLMGVEVWILEEHWFLVVVGAPLLSMYSPACVRIFIAALVLCIFTSLKAASTPPCLSMKS